VGFKRGVCLCVETGERVRESMREKHKVKERLKGGGMRGERSVFAVLVIMSKTTL